MRGIFRGYNSNVPLSDISILNTINLINKVEMLSDYNSSLPFPNISK